MIILIASNLLNSYKSIKFLILWFYTSP